MSRVSQGTKVPRLQSATLLRQQQQQRVTSASSIRPRDAILNAETLHAPPLVKARLLLDMVQRVEYHNNVYRAFAKRLILNTKGQACYNLKRELSNLGANAGFVNVVYDYILNKEHREQVLAHLKEQVPKIRLATSRDRLIVLSDVDDTMFQSSALMGGPKYPSKSKFPGVEKLFVELAWKVVFITARPSVMKGMTMGDIRKKVNIPNFGMLCGKTSDLLWAAFDRKRAFAKMAIQKYHNFDMMSSCYPECKFVWFGDSGQGDIVAGQMMMEHKRDQMLAVFIHDIVDTTGISPKTAHPERNNLRQSDGIVHIDTYLDAALALNRVGSLSLQSLFRVACAASEEWKELSVHGRWASEDVRAARAKEITADLEKVNIILLHNDMATVSVDDTSLPPSLTPRISPRRKKELIVEAHIHSLSELDQLKFRASQADLLAASRDSRGNISRSSSKGARPNRGMSASSASSSSTAASSKTGGRISRVSSTATDGTDAAEMTDSVDEWEQRESRVIKSVASAVNLTLTDDLSIRPTLSRPKSMAAMNSKISSSSINVDFAMAGTRRLKSIDTADLSSDARFVTENAGALTPRTKSRMSPAVAKIALETD